MWCKKKSQWLLCIWKMASLHWNPQHHLLNSPIEIGDGSSSSKHTLFSSTLAPGKSGGKALTPQLQCRGDCTTEADTSLVTLGFYWAPSRSSASGWDVPTDVLSTWLLSKSYLRARVPLKRTLLSVHVFFHNWMCWSPKLLFLPKLLHNSKLQYDISSDTSGGLSKIPSYSLKHYSGHNWPASFLVHNHPAYSADY